MKTQKVEFGNWVPGKMILFPVLLGLLCFGLGFLRWPFFIPALLFLVVALYFAVSWYIFSPKGSNVQDKVQELLIQHISTRQYGKILDVGCGSGALAIKAAQHFPQAEVLGIDYWGKSWDYSMQVCERNARSSGVGDRVSFRQASAVSLPFKDASFDLVISNLVFHEVRDAQDKRVPIREALRVLNPGGAFVLQDLFLLRPYFGTPEELRATLHGWGASQVEFIPTHTADFIPAWVKLPFMLGTVAILQGVK